MFFTRVKKGDTRGCLHARGRAILSRASFAVADVVLLGVSIFAAYALRFNFAIPSNHVALLPYVVVFALAIELVAMRLFGCFRTVWRFFSAVDMPALIRAVASSTVVFLACRILFHDAAIRFYPPISVSLMNFVLSLALLAGARWFCRTAAEPRSCGAADAKRVIIVGADPLGGAIAYALRHERPVVRDVVGYLDDSPEVAGSSIQGLPVFGGIDDASRVMRERGIDEAIVSPSALPRERLQMLFTAAADAGVRLMVAPDYSSMLDGGASTADRLRGAEITDLLRRSEIKIDDLRLLRGFLAGRRVMVTGAGGSIGSEISRQVLNAGVASLVLVEHGEYALYSISRELEAAEGADHVRKYIADVADETRMRKIIDTEKPEIVFHAAAYKHVPLMEENVCEAVRNNIFGTVRLARLCSENGVRGFVLLSSDKAVEPTSVMGATKRFCELAIQGLNGSSATSFSAVRFGNVLASTGSVVPLFREQIANGGPVTVTDPAMTRYFMTIPEAVSLTLEAAAMGMESKGRVYVLDMGHPIRITELAEEMIRLSGKRPGKDIEISFVGIRPGEKLEERLVAADEVLSPTGHPQIGSFEMKPVGVETFAMAMRLLEDAVVAADDDKARSVLMRYVGKGDAA